jgi:hypothetical protein
MLRVNRHPLRRLPRIGILRPERGDLGLGAGAIQNYFMDNIFPHTHNFWIIK